MAITLLLTGIVFIIAGLWLNKFPPKRINRIYGYRIGKAMLSQKAWDLSQPYAGKLMAKIGAILSICGLPFLFINIPETIENILILVVVGVIIGSVFFLIRKTESYVTKKLKEE